MAVVRDYSKEDVECQRVLSRPWFLSTPGPQLVLNAKSQDDRNPSFRECYSLKPARLQPLGTPKKLTSNVSHHRGEHVPRWVESPLPGFEDSITWKHNLNNAHAASFEKSREKNSQLKEHQAGQSYDSRQGHLSDFVALHPGVGQDVSDSFTLPLAGRGGHTNDGYTSTGGRDTKRRGVPSYDYCGWVPEDNLWTGEPDLPHVSTETLEAASCNSITRTIDIDGIPREIRSYGDTAVILLDWNDPRILTFGEGHCNIVFNGGQFSLPIKIGENYKKLTISGKILFIKLGVPTQELIVDGKGHQCFFGGKPITLHLAGQPHTVSLDGKPPNVNIGPVRNTRLLAGKIQLVIDEVFSKVVDLYLDAKPQRFNIDGEQFIIKFVDALRAVAINNVRFPVEFGGLPLSISVRGYRHLLRFSPLPHGIIPGQVDIQGIELDRELSSLSGRISHDNVLESVIRPICGPSFNVPLNRLNDFPDGSIFSPPVDVLIRHQRPPPEPRHPSHQGFAIHVPPPQVHAYAGPGSMMLQDPSTVTSPSGMPVVTIKSQLHSQPGDVLSVANPDSHLISQLPPNMIQPSQLLKPLSFGPNPLLQKEHKKILNEKVEKEKEEENVEFISFELMFDKENLRRRKMSVIASLYGGKQCSSCGQRFPPEDVKEYSAHLDWHFRQNRRQKDSTKKGNMRNFYLSAEDWIHYEGIEDIKEKAVPSFFECAGAEKTKSEEKAVEEPCVIVSPDSTLRVCPGCHETFRQFYDQEDEEWKYKNVINVDGVNFHPSCHQDMLMIASRKI